MMKSVFSMALLLCASQVLACTNLIVGKKASQDGSVLVSYSADSYGMYGNMYRHVGGVHSKGETRKIYDWDTDKYLGEIPQAERTYNVVGQMNEHQVSICETTFGGRSELVDPQGLIDYGSLIYIALERSTSAREAIKIMTDLVATYGYYSEGESFTVADKNEVWVMEMVGMGPGSRNAAWVAVRIPDDCISAHANQSRITRYFTLYPKGDVLYNKENVKFARGKGWFSGKDSEFSFRDAFNAPDFSGARFCDARVWSFFNRHVDGMDKYLPYINGENLKDEMPLYVKPQSLVSLQQLKDDMRDHYEGTPLDITEDLGAGPYTMPYRPSPLTFTVDGKEYFNERPISTQQAAFTFVGQMRSWLPDAVGGIVWWGNDDANMVPYTPVYCGVTDIPRCYVKVKGVQDDVTFSWESAFWLQNVVSNTVYPYYSKMYPDLREVLDRLEWQFAGEVNKVDGEAKTLWESQPNAVGRYLTAYCNGAADRMMDDWDKLYRYLVVKHNDMVVKKVGADGKFQLTETGLADSPVRPGYPENFNRRVVEETGGRYLMKK